MTTPSDSARLAALPQRAIDEAQTALRDAERQRRRLLGELRVLNHRLATLETILLAAGVEPADVAGTNSGPANCAVAATGEEGAACS